MIKLFHAKGSRSVRIIWLFEELGMDYQLDTVERGKPNKAFGEASIFAKIPAIQDGDITLTESVAIIQYILQKYGGGGLQPSVDSDDYAMYLQWLNFGESTLIQPIVEILVNTMFRSEENRHQYSIDSGIQSFKKIAQSLDPVLSQQNYLLGSQFSAADIVNGYTLRLANRLQLLDDSEGIENVCDYFRRLEAREAYQKAISI
ncbi:glutathione S-transferase family protein [Gammaproteobacteria bacterium]|jgi:glutathione S-transferase|nr:glutathione S-transferase family protein [Gammaproteobacteria bacterium]|tara:strand:+ start:931 stop:1539 length:609 start_codon:yes stop_codon:yes gene_type:complete